MRDHLTQSDQAVKPHQPATTLRSHEYVLWIMMMAYAAHILEEYTLDWSSWAKQALGLEVSWPHFYVVNFIVIVLGIGAAAVAWRLPAVSLMFPALALINGIFFHIGPTLAQGRFSPGTITAVLLFLPIGLWSYYSAYLDGVLTRRRLLISLMGGVVIMAYPIILIRLRPVLGVH